MKHHHLGFLSLSCLLLFFALAACEQNAPSLRAERKQILSYEDSMAIRLDSLQQISKPIMGFRFVITGDFDGDHNIDTLIERYTDSTSRKEVALYDEVMEYQDLIFCANRNKYRSFLQPNLSGKINSLLKGGILGFHYAENCGDVNRDGKDDVLLVRTNGDFSNLNHAYIYSLQNGEWKEIYSIGVWEWMFPPTPSASMLPGMFGNYDFGISTSDSSDAALLKELNDFRFIKRTESCWIEHECMNEYWNEFETNEDMETIHTKRFKKVKLGTEWFYQDLNLKAKFLKIESENGLRPDGSDYYLNLDDPAESLTIRINICSSNSLFSTKRE